MATETRHKQERPDASAPSARTADRSHEVQRQDWNRPSFSPFSIMRQGIDEMERWFGHPGRGSSGGRGWMSQLAHQLGDWMPAVEAFQRGDQFVVRAEVPGMTRQDLTVEVGDDALSIRGERKHERQDDREGVFWSERSYGSFARTIPLPPGVIADSAKASFTNGMLEVVMQAPPADARRGRRVDITGAPHEEKKP